jgi:hypothetical protein
MPTERLSMHHIREVLRLHYSVSISQRAVTRSLGMAQGTVSKYLNRTHRAPHRCARAKEGGSDCHSSMRRRNCCADGPCNTVQNR